MPGVRGAAIGGAEVAVAPGHSDVAQRSLYYIRRHQYYKWYMVGEDATTSAREKLSR